MNKDREKSILERETKQTLSSAEIESILLTITYALERINKHYDNDDLKEYYKWLQERDYHAYEDMVENYTSPDDDVTADDYTQLEGYEEWFEYMQTLSYLRQQLVSMLQVIKEQPDIKIEHRDNVPQAEPSEDDIPF